MHRDIPTSEKLLKVLETFRPEGSLIDFLKKL